MSCSVLVAGQGFPAHAGMDPDVLRDTLLVLRLPRTRGDGPRRKVRAGQSIEASPHTRGWTQQS